MVKNRRSLSTQAGVCKCQMWVTLQSSLVFLNSAHRTRAILFPEHRTNTYLSNNRTQNKHLFIQQQNTEQTPIYPTTEHRTNTYLSNNRTQNKHLLIQQQNTEQTPTYPTTEHRTNTYLSNNRTQNKHLFIEQKDY